MGIAGSGKSTLANVIASGHALNKESCAICCADNYFTDGFGNYNWIASKVGEAHKYCRDRFTEAINYNVNCIIVANTNTQKSDYSFYEELAIKNNYFVQKILVGELTDEACERYVSQNTHKVPRDTIYKMRDRLVKSITSI
jgi:hypothetical protein